MYGVALKAQQNEHVKKQNRIACVSECVWLLHAGDQEFVVKSRCDLVILVSLSRGHVDQESEHAYK